ncbi:MAG TPA: GNAT family N-acetyltransferase [Candidatus Acidoferrales bacterium]|nr:GNAT family N-acetyltransferase [Candidatus Acidoferrales bacterium]
MNPITVAPATESDVPAILEMIAELAEFERLAHEVRIDANLLRAALFGDRPVAAALLGRVEGAAAGYAIYYRTFSTFVGRPGVFLEDIYVRPRFRKRGLGRAMLEAVAQASLALGGGRLEWMALNWNENALNFYRGLGAQVMGDWLLLRMTGGEVGRFVKGTKINV